MTTKSESTRATRKNRQDGTAEQASLILPEAIDQRFARDLKKLLLVLVDQKRPCVIDGHQVCKSSTACLQLLTVFARGMSREGSLVMLRKPSAILLKNFESLGLAWPTAQLELEH